MFVLGQFQADRPQRIEKGPQGVFVDGPGAALLLALGQFRHGIGGDDFLLDNAPAAAEGLPPVRRQGDDGVFAIGLVEIAVVDALADHVADFGQREVAEHAEGRVVLEAITADLGVLAALEDVADHGHAEAALQFVDAEADAADLFGHVFFDRLLVTVAAFLAALPRRMLAEISQDIMAQAVIAFAVADHGVEQAKFDGLLLRVVDGLLDEELLDHDVLAAEEEDTFPRRAVAAGPARFLIVAFDVLGHLVVDDVADVALVDAHAEGIGGDDDLYLVVRKGVLHGPAHVITETGMVMTGFDAAPRQFLIDPVYFLARRRIDDAAVFLMLLDVGQGKVELAVRADDAEIEVRPVEAADKDAFLLQAQEVHHILLDLFRRRRRESPDDRPLRQGRDPVLDGTVAGPEIVAPLGDAVRFIDDEHGNIDALHEGREEFVFQAFRRDVDQFHPARTDGSEAGLRLFKGTLAVDVCRRYLLIDQAVDLVLHERDERRNDEGHAGLDQGRQLEADRLACTGRHDGQAVPAVEKGLDDLMLAGPERRIAKILF